MKLLVVPALLALAMPACTELPDVEPGSCGNLVLDPGEDCDEFSAFPGAACGAAGTTNQCAYVCSDSAACPDGYLCSVPENGEGRCAAPSDAYAQLLGPIAFRSFDYDVGDVDGDGLQDLIGNSSSTISVLYGARGGDFPTGLDVSIPALTGRIVYGEFDSDGRTDAVLPVTSGLFTLRGVADRTLDPVAYAPFDLSEANAKGAIRLVSADIDERRVNDDLLVFAENDDCAPTAGFMMVFESGGDTEVLPEGFLTSQIPGRIPISRKPGVAARMALSFRDDERNDDDRVWVYDLQSQANRLRFSDPVVVCAAGEGIAPGACRPGQIFNGTHFADYDGDGTDDLFMSIFVPGANLRTMVALGVAGGGGFDQPFAPFEDPLNEDDDEPWPIAVGLINDDLVADYVFPQGVVIPVGGGVQVPAQPGSVPWSDAILVDINADGRMDIAAIAENEPGVDIFLNTGTPNFNKFRINTVDPVAVLQSGDFDGDLVQDVALAETGFGATPDHVSVIFGEALGAPSEPVSMGNLDEIESMVPTAFGLAVDAFDSITDLAVVSAPVAELGCADGEGRPPRVAAILQGSSSRRMLSPFTLKEEETTLPDRPLSVVVGHFMSEDSRDVLATAEIVLGVNADTPEGGPSAAGEARLYGIPGKGTDGDLDAAAQVVGDPFEPGVFEFRCAVWTVADIDPGGADPDAVGGLDEVLGLDQTVFCDNGGGFSAPPDFVSVRVAESVDPSPIDITGFTTPIDLKVADLDGDLDNDVIIAFLGEFQAASDGGSAVENSGLLVLWNDDGTFDPDNSTTLQVPFGAPFDLDVIDEGRPHPTVLALALDSVYRSTYDDETDDLPALEPYLFNPNFCTRLEVGDISADGLPDVILANDLEVYAWLQSPAAPLGGFSDDVISLPTEQNP